MPTLKERKEYTDKAAAAYQAFKVRTENNLLLTREEKVAKLETFLDAHVGIFDDYFAEVKRIRHPGPGQKVRYLTGDEMLSSSALGMAEEIAALFASSETGRYYLEEDTQGYGQAGMISHLDDLGGRLISQVRKADDANDSYFATARDTFARKDRRTSLIFNDEDPAVVQKAAREQARENARAASPAVSPAEEAEGRIKIAEARVNLANADIEAAQRAINDAMVAARAAQEPVPQAEEAATRARNIFETTKKYTSDRQTLEGVWSSVQDAEEKRDRLRNRAAQAQAMVGNANVALRTALDAKQAAEDELRQAQNAAANDPVKKRTFQTKDRSEGLNQAQIKGIRDISAFLYRNTLHGRENIRLSRADFVDGVLRCSPRQKLLMFYLIEKDKLHGTPNEQELLDSQDPQAYIPDLAAFKPHIFGGVLGGFFGRATGNALDWDKLSDAAQSAGDMIDEVYQLLSVRAAGGDPAAAQAMANAQPNPALAAAIQRLVDAGNVYVMNPNPAAMADLRNALDVLASYISSQEKGRWDESQGWVSENSLWYGYIVKPVGIISSFLGAGSEAAGGLSTTAGGIMGSLGIGIGYDAGGFGMISTLASCFTFLGSCVDIVRTGKTHPGWGRMTLEIMGGIKDFSSMGTSVFGSVRTIAGWSKAGWASAGGAVAGGWAGAAVGVMTAIQGGYRAWKGRKEEGRITDYESKLAGYQPANLPANQPQNPQIQQARKEALDALYNEKAMLADLAAIEKDNAHRRRIAGRYQAVAGALQAVSGALVAFGITAFFSAGFSAAAFVVGLMGAVKNYKMKNASKDSVIDSFIGMNIIYPEFKKNHTEEGTDFNKEFGSDEDVKRAIRGQVVRSLGFPSVDKMHAHIMWKYAQALYTGAFINNGAVLTQTDESNLSQDERDHRALYTDFIKSLGFEIEYPANNNESVSPDVNTIYKKLMS